MYHEVKEVTGYLSDGLTTVYRYKYLRGPNGAFRNPFDKGCLGNCRDACLPGFTPRAPISLEDLDRDALLNAERGLR